VSLIFIFGISKCHLFTKRPLEVSKELEKATPGSQSSATDVMISGRFGSIPNNLPGNLNQHEEGLRKKDIYSVLPMQEEGCSCETQGNF